MYILLLQSKSDAADLKKKIQETVVSLTNLESLSRPFLKTVKHALDDTKKIKERYEAYNVV